MADFAYDQVEATNLVTNTIDTASASTLNIGTVSASDINIGNSFTTVTIAGTPFAAAPANKGSILAGNGTTFGAVTLTFPTDEGKVLVARASASRGVTWETGGGGGGPGSWNTLDLDTVTAISPVASISGANERSEYVENGSLCIVNLDFELTTDGTGPSSTLLFDMPAAKNISAVSISGTRSSTVAFVSDIGTGSTQICHIFLDPGVGSGDRFTLSTTGIFENTTTYRVHASLTYRIS